MGSIIDIGGVRVGTFSDQVSATGCTVFLFEKPVLGAVDIRGGGSSTRQADSMLPWGTYGMVNALFLSGGSGYGLDATGGVLRFLEERGIGLSVGYGKVVPSVPSAVIFDLGIGNGDKRPDSDMAYSACVNASDTTVEEGSFGVGTGATVGKIFGVTRSTKGGVGSASFHFKDSGVVVGVYTVVNSYGDVYSPQTGEIIAGVRDEKHKDKFLNTVELIKQGYGKPYTYSQNTTIAVVVTNVSLDKTELRRICIMAHTGMAKVISPLNTVVDGDIVFAFSTGECKSKGDANSIGIVASELVSLSIVRAIEYAEGICGVPSFSDIRSYKSQG